MRLGELIGQDPVARRDGAPSPASGRETKDGDLEGIPGFGAVDRHRSRQRREDAAIELRQIVDFGRGGDLATRAVDNIELDRIAGSDGYDRRVGPVPAE